MLKYGGTDSRILEESLFSPSEEINDSSTPQMYFERTFMINEQSFQESLLSRGIEEVSSSRGFKKLHPIENMKKLYPAEQMKKLGQEELLKDQKEQWDINHIKMIQPQETIVVMSSIISTIISHKYLMKHLLKE